ncbi:hypothetical protein [Crateriforma conspicua]|uniref:Uncharacterized protein n=1 Tax=Crateriforma conspicua TaxID=2527996 RepID=A0A5C5YBF6_9PLAN|nr:hypothetical protein [Crateriforma conspicua]QDV61446.1 hypothetical protein Mal65_05690 [Crateriforma conspicua]TWT72309.1 hypothetical protein Pan14r_46290 [Crateriforma conspicua]
MNQWIKWTLAPVAALAFTLAGDAPKADAGGFSLSIGTGGYGYSSFGYSRYGAYRPYYGPSIRPYPTATIYRSRSIGVPVRAPSYYHRSYHVRPAPHVHYRPPVVIGHGHHYGRYPGHYDYHRHRHYHH